MPKYPGLTGFTKPRVLIVTPSVLLIIGHFKQESLDHLVMLSIERDKSKRLLDRRGCDERIEYVEPVRFCVSLQESICSRSDAVAERDNRIQRQETIDSPKFPLVSGANDEFHRGNLRDRPRFWETVDVFDCCRVAA